MNPKFIFLDIDGPLVTREEMKRDFRISQDIQDGLVQTFRPSALAALNEITTKTKAKIVISSTWRRVHSLSELRGIFMRQGVQGEVHSVTPVDTFGVRWVQIRGWFEQYGGFPRHVIIDDDEGACGPDKGVFIQCYGFPGEGLTMEDARKAIKVLNG